MKDLVKKRFGKLVAIRHTGSNHQKRRVWECICDCGKVIHVPSNYLLSGDTKSCGCLIGRAPQHGHKIGKRQSKVYTAWCNMKARCFQPKSSMYNAYGARGISVANRWKDSFENFLVDIGEPSRPNLTLERLDPNGNYEPGNVVWASELVQRLNKQDTQTEFTDLKDTLRELCRRSGISYDSLFEEFLAGRSMMSILDASDSQSVNTPASEE